MSDDRDAVDPDLYAATVAENAALRQQLARDKADYEDAMLRMGTEMREVRQQLADEKERANGLRDVAQHATQTVADLEASLLAVARAAGYYYSAEGLTEAPAPTDVIVAGIEAMQRDLAEAREATEHKREELALAIKKIEELNAYDLQRHKQLMEARERAETVTANAAQALTAAAEALEAERAAHAECRRLNAKLTLYSAEELPLVEELALARRERDQEEEQKGEWIEVANNLRLERDAALALLKETAYVLRKMDDCGFAYLLTRLDALLAEKGAQ